MLNTITVLVKHQTLDKLYLVRNLLNFKILRCVRLNQLLRPHDAPTCGTKQDWIGLQQSLAQLEATKMPLKLSEVQSHTHE